MEEQAIILTAKGLQDLEDELQDLKLNRRKANQEKIKEAREQGDLSENAEYDAAKDEQREIEGRIEEIEETLKHAVVVDSDSASGIGIGSRVTLIRTDNGSDREYVFDVVGTTEADSRARKISNESPVGSAMIGKNAGDEISVESPSGVSHFKIVNVEVTP